ncbi:prevent-host-death family protein [Candidatus Moduliflexus flocculans]|uniref:Prevent-host-death family protein n=1 Tax=Candidatus Moduliflexus flocculans TaxID=1499966 RepID=A0A0S6VR56_9BACT|nr:prevent-host-death family protein [Candidatus Moduliflexus flocculans]
MSVYVYTEALQKFAFLLEEAFRTGEVKVRRDDGKVFVIKPEPSLASPLDVESVNFGITTEEILECIHESREGRL